MDTSTCRTCTHMCYVHEYDIYFCTKGQHNVNLDDEACENYKRYLYEEYEE